MILAALLLSMHQASAQTVVTVSDISAGGYFNCVKFTNGLIKCFGNNSYGQLGYGDTLNRGAGDKDMGNNLPFVSIGSVNGESLQVDKIFNGMHHVCVKISNNDSNGKDCKCFGRNDYGQLGLGDRNSRGDGSNEMSDSLQFVDLGKDVLVVNMGLGLFHSCALVSGTPGVKCFGYNLYGQLGYEDKYDRGDTVNQMGNDLPFVDFGNGIVVVNVVSGWYHNCVVLSDSSCKCWGLNAYGQLGLGDMNDRGDETNEMGDNLPILDLGIGRKVTSISAGGYHTCGLLDNQKIKCWGLNNYGQLGLEDSKTRGIGADEMGDKLPAILFDKKMKPIAISVGGEHSCALFAKNRLVCWGKNDNGQLGIGDIFSRGDGKNEMGDKIKEVDIGGGLNIIKITSGASHNCVRFSDNSIKCWGYNKDGTLGLGNDVSRGTKSDQLGDKLPFLVLHEPDLVDICEGLTRKKCAKQDGCKWNGSSCELIKPTVCSGLDSKKSCMKKKSFCDWKNGVCVDKV